MLFLVGIFSKVDPKTPKKFPGAPPLDPANALCDAFGDGGFAALEFRDVRSFLHEISGTPENSHFAREL